jgi:hypothetical protein
MDNPDASATSGPRRSGRLAAIGTATVNKPVETVQTSKSTTQKNSTSNSLGSKGTKKPTPKTSKANAAKLGKEDTKKTTRMNLPAVEDQDEPPQKEAKKILNPLLNEIEAVLTNFEDGHQGSHWYKDLKLHFHLLGDIPNNIEFRKDLADRAELKLPFGCPSQDDLADGTAGNYPLLEVKFKDLERHREAIVRKGLEPVAPSAYCLRRAYISYQLDKRTAIRAGRPGPFSLPLELFHTAFRTYTGWALHKSDSFQDDEHFIELDRCVRTLQDTMPQFFATHDERQKAFLEALLEVFPQTDLYGWFQNEPADLLNPPYNRTKHKIDLVYLHKTTRIPLIFVEIKLEMGEGGDPFWQNNRLYQTFITSCPAVRKSGAPVFFLHISGMTFMHDNYFHFSHFFSPGVHLGLGGAYCDAKDEPPVVQQLGGYVNLQYDFTGRNFDEGYRMIRALRHAIKEIPT